MNAIMRWGTASQLALAGVLLTAVVAGVELADAVHIESPPPAHAVTENELAMADVATSSIGASRTVVFTAVAKDPFRYDRRRPSARYRLPGEEASSTGAPAPSRPAFTGLTLVGTALRGEARMAVLQEARLPPRMVHVGDSIGVFELVSVERRTATLRSADTTVVLLLPGPPGGEHDTTRTRGSGSR